LVILINFLGFNKIGEAVSIIIIFALMAIGMVATDLLAVSWFGLWMGLTNKKSAHAVAKTVIYVLVLPLFTLGCWCLWPLMAMLKNAIFMNYARTRLRQQFRNVVTEGMARKRMPWQRPGSWPPRLPSVLDK